MSKILVPALAVALSLVGSGCQPTQPADAVATSSTAAVGASGSAETVSEEDSRAVATIGDRTITVGEIDDFIKDGLFAKQSSNGNPAQLYEMRSKALEQYIEQAIVVDAAKARGLTVEEFLEQSVIKESEIPQEEVAAFFEENSAQIGDATLEQIEPRIRTHLRTVRATEFVEKLQAETESEILLQPARIEVGSDGPSQGPQNAPVTIVAFSDFECPYCKRVVPTLHELIEKYPEQVRIVFRHLPLDRIHQRARPAAEASACADKQNLFWPFHDVLFENNNALSDEDFAKYAGEAGLDVAAFKTCVADREFQAAVQSDAEAGEALGLRGTPAFFINGIPMRGAKPLEEFVRIIDAELERQPVAASNG